MEYAVETRPYMRRRGLWRWATSPVIVDQRCLFMVGCRGSHISSMRAEPRPEFPDSARCRTRITPRNHASGWSRGICQVSYRERFSPSEVVLTRSSQDGRTERESTLANANGVSGTGGNDSERTHTICLDLDLDLSDDLMDAHSGPANNDFDHVNHCSRCPARPAQAAPPTHGRGLGSAARFLLNTHRTDPVLGKPYSECANSYLMGSTASTRR